MSEYRQRGVVRKGRYAPIHFVAARAKLTDGTVRIGLFAMDDVAREQLAERKVGEGTEWKAEIKQTRNVGFWRMVHKLGQWLAEHHDDFEGMDGHSAVKELQRRSGIGCDVTRSDIRDNDGTLLYRVVSYQPQSLAFDLMDEGEFKMLWSGSSGKGGWLGYLRKNLYRNMPDMTVEEIERMVMGRVIEWSDAQ